MSFLQPNYCTSSALILFLPLHEGCPVEAVQFLAGLSPFLQCWSFCLPTALFSLCLPEAAVLRMVQWMDEPLTKCLVRLAAQLEHTEPSFQAASIIQRTIGHGNCHTALTVLSKIFMALWSEMSLFAKEF